MPKETDEVVERRKERFPELYAQRELEIDEEHARLGLFLEGEERKAFENWRDYIAVVHLHLKGVFRGDYDRTIDDYTEILLCECARLNAWFTTMFPEMKNVAHVVYDEYVAYVVFDEDDDE